MAITARTHAAQPPSLRMHSHSQAQYLQHSLRCFAKNGCETTTSHEITACSSFDSLHSTKQVCEHVLAAHEASGSLCSMSWHSYWRAAYEAASEAFKNLL